MAQVKETRIHRIPKRGAVDPIDVFIDWYGEHQSQVTIRCWDTAWTSYWGGHWYAEVEHFLAEVSLDYLTTCMGSGLHRKKSEEWRRKVCESMQLFFQEQGFGKKEEQ